MKKKNNFKPTEKQIQKFEKLFSLVSQLASDMDKFSKKSPDGVLNQLKVKMINKVLTQIKDFFDSDSVVEFLELLDDEALISNSDSVLIMGQYISVMNQFKDKYYGRDESDMSRIIYKWDTEESPSILESKRKYYG